MTPGPDQIIFSAFGHTASSRSVQWSNQSDRFDYLSDPASHSSETGHDRSTVVRRRLDYADALRTLFTRPKSADDYFGEWSPGGNGGAI